ncbi:hypothetical protein R1sor_004723 [Riccia sorocarpa]|uniref:Uncharacterized protein n=1 Tax=Riccia sorocarpa TaxID=122646 RepID=A0ABD3HKF5_9MARC
MPSEKISLLAACQEDMCRAALQSSKSYLFRNLGRKVGKGPDIYELMFRASVRKGDGREFVKAFNDFVSRTPFEQNVKLSEDINIVTVNKPLREARRESINDSWRPDKDICMISKRRPADCLRRMVHDSKKIHEETQEIPLPSTLDTQIPDTEAGGCSSGGKRKFSLGSCPSSAIPIASDTETSEDVAEAKIARSASPVTEEVMPAAVHRVQDNVDEIIYFDTTVRKFGLDIFETEIDETSWHIARTSGKSPVCRAKTWGTVRNSRPQCGAYVARQPYAKFPAPTFRKPQERFRETRFASDRFWCCLNDVCAFGKLADFLEGRKPKVPSVWPVVCGTHLTQVEVDELTKFGFRLVPYIGPVHVLEPSMNDIRSVVNVETFPEDLSRLSSSTVAKTRAGKPFNRRHLVSKTKLSRIKVAQDGSIVLKARKLVHTGKNSFGVLFWSRNEVTRMISHALA